MKLFHFVRNFIFGLCVMLENNDSFILNEAKVNRNTILYGVPSGQALFA
jgi:hypothetical protein